MAVVNAPGIARRAPPSRAGRPCYVQIGVPGRAGPRPAMRDGAGQALPLRKGAAFGRQVRPAHSVGVCLKTASVA